MRSLTGVVCPEIIVIAFQFGYPAVAFNYNVENVMSDNFELRLIYDPDIWALRVTSNLYDSIPTLS